MRKVELTAPGAGNLIVTNADEPTPGSGEVLVRVHSASINYRDFMIVMGHYKPELPLPLIPLSDGAGEVVAVGAEVTRVAVGERVASMFWQDWADGPPSRAALKSSTGCEAPGMLCEYALLPETAVTRIPDRLTYEQAATVPCAGLTAWHSLRTLAGLEVGASVLVLGTGGVALYALQFAKAMGATVIITSSSDEKLARAAALGADHGINYRQHDDWGARAFALAGGGVEVVIETGGAGTLMQSIAALGWDGHIAYLGMLAGMSADLNLFGLVVKNAHLHGLTVGNRAEQEAMLAFMDAHAIAPVIDQRFELEQGPQAISAIAAGAHFGKLVVNLA